jgi:hypothetical protein
VGAPSLERVCPVASRAGLSPLVCSPNTIPGGCVVRDANGQAPYIYSRDNEADALQANVLTKDEARRIAVNVARLLGLLGKRDCD